MLICVSMKVAVIIWLYNSCVLPRIVTMQESGLIFGGGVGEVLYNILNKSDLKEKAFY